MRISFLAFALATIGFTSCATTKVKTKAPIGKFSYQKKYHICFIIAGSDTTIYNYIELPEEITEVSKSADTPTVMHVHQQGDTLVLGFIPKYPKNSQK